MEGWGLTATEHACTGAPQVVPDHSACRELFEDCGILIPISAELIGTDTLTKSGLVSPEGVAVSLENLYYNKKLYDELAQKGYEKFTDNRFLWTTIVKEQWNPLFRKIF